MSGIENPTKFLKIDIVETIFFSDFGSKLWVPSTQKSSRMICRWQGAKPLHQIWPTKLEIDHLLERNASLTIFNGSHVIYCHEGQVKWLANNNNLEFGDSILQKLGSSQSIMRVVQ